MVGHEIVLFVGVEFVNGGCEALLGSFGGGGFGFSKSNPQRQILGLPLVLFRMRRFFRLCFTLGAQGAWIFR